MAVLKFLRMADHNIRLFSATSHPELAELIAQSLGISVSPVTIKKFACGEIYVRFEETVRGKDVYLVATCRSGTVNEDFMELFMLCDAARQSFAKSIHVILPFFGYSRQDKIHEARENISARLMSDLLMKSGAQHVITVQLHSDQIQGFFDVPVDNLHIRKLVSEYFLSKKIQGEIVVVSPDAGGAKQTKKLADKLGCNMAIIHKTRPAHNVASVTHMVGDVQGKTAILLDDMVDTAGSVMAACQALREAGANQEIYLCATHPIFSPPAIERLKECGFHEIVVSNSIPLSEEAKKELPIKVIDIAPLLAHVVESVMGEQSASKWYS